jgi:Lsr2 protein
MASITTTLDDMTGDALPADTPTTLVTIRDPRNPNAAFEIDLSDDSFKGLLKAVEKFRVKGRDYTPPTLRQSITGDSEAREFAAKARQWAIATNLQPPVSDRGAVPQRALDAYREHLANSEQEQEQEQGNTDEN